MIAILPSLITVLIHPDRLLDVGALKTVAVIYLVASLLAMLVSFFKSAQRIDAEQVAALGHISAVPNISSADWQEMADRFKAIGTGVRAEWKSNDGAVTWDLNGKHECSALCMKAGAMLLRSPAMLKDVPVSALADSTHLNRWMEFVKSKRGTQGSQSFPDERPDGTKFFQNIAYINDVSGTSYVLCVECSAHEV
jgi:hypothetical protein